MGDVWSSGDSCALRCTATSSPCPSRNPIEPPAIPGVRFRGPLWGYKLGLLERALATNSPGSSPMLSDRNVRSTLHQRFYPKQRCSSSFNSEISSGSVLQHPPTTIPPHISSHLLSATTARSSFAHRTSPLPFASQECVTVL